jgi:hypothetical protein
MLQRFTGGVRKEALDKLNALVDEINSLAGLRGDPYITVSRGPGGTAVGLNIQAVVARVPKLSSVAMSLFVISVQADYLTCNTESDGSGTTYYVAKPPRLRSTDTAARAVAGQTYTVTKSGFTTGVTSGDAQTCTATRSSDSGTDTLEVVEPYEAGDEICALPYGDTYLDDPDGNAITLLDANVDARHWAVKASS